MAWSSVLPAFLASIVEFVEALTIVVVIGVTINWKSSLLGAAAAFLALVVLIAAFGTALVNYVPIGVLRMIVGVILVLFGLQWLKKSVLRFSGLKAIHDEAAIYEDRLRELQARGEIHQGHFNGFGFATSFKSVLLEGLEVAFIVITFGVTAGADKSTGILNAALGAFGAFLVVTLLGISIRKPLTKIPENTLKFVVGVMLVTFGTFWSGEGLGLNWPGADLFLLALVVWNLLVSFILVLWLKPFAKKDRKGHHTVAKPLRSPILKGLKAVFDFFCGDWRVFWSVAVLILIVALGFRFISATWYASAVCALYTLGIAGSLAFALQKETVTVKNTAK